jgi:hypothetical protein
LHFFDFLFHGIEFILQLFCIILEFLYLFGLREEVSPVTVSLPVHAAATVVLMPPVMSTAATFFIHILSHLDFLPNTIRSKAFKLSSL